MADDKYISDAQQRLLLLIETLSGNEMEGLAPGQIAKLNGCSPSQVTRDLSNLRHAHWAEQIGTTGRWRLGTKPVHISVRHMTALDRAQRKMDELKQRFALGADSDSARHALNRFSKD